MFLQVTNSIGKKKKEKNYCSRERRKTHTHTHTHFEYEGMHRWITECVSGADKVYCTCCYVSDQEKKKSLMSWALLREQGLTERD